MGLKNDRYYFSLFPSKRNFFLFKQLSFLQKLMFIIVSIFFYVIVVPAYAIPSVLTVCVFREPAAEMISLVQYHYVSLIFTFVFKIFIRFNYKLAWKDVVYKSVEEYDYTYTKLYTQEARDYWERRQIIIDRMAEIYDF